ncbi:hypothetical protein NLD30_01560 [SCandidatus Aminicenantes bacterium Aminicenantia_JdfR_composite]|jgi:hypothetical protein|nr:hypothetical protein [SCandidatus Aminicenantes bacterium Aminicenantia_JdfR_composite]MCP2596281.1 hypothetical protein [Candidatus Aminicenantes bacterium AC-335-G13]MCP2597856.1 hypothetical protein [Candidatus Aminicenantes bacterium AC-335-L06]MCP2605605.1 hypothetical protein [Candidatus Aminicenantes bacterium AC-335-O07]MCP2620487.1 hypothetical protein [Candidatus Aminicenantes bacterium AC-334-E05]
MRFDRKRVSYLKEHQDTDFIATIRNSIEPINLAAMKLTQQKRLLFLL